MLDELRARKARWRTRRWVTVHRGPDVRPLPDVGLHALLATWNEADVVAITVGNALEQGCDAVHLLDNGSDDDTVALAEAAGATVAEVFHTDRYDGDAALPRAQRLVDEVSHRLGLPHLWWLTIDADELVEGPDGSTVREHLSRLDRSIRVVGSHTVNHYPVAAHPIASGADPRGFPTYAQPRLGSACSLGHWKHPLLRWDAAGPPIRLRHGAHVAACEARLVEAPIPIVSHHYPYRNELVSRRRLDALAPRLSGEQWAMGRRRRNADAVYRAAWSEVDAHDLVGPGQPFGPLLEPPVRTPPSA